MSRWHKGQLRGGSKAAKTGLRRTAYSEHGSPELRARQEGQDQDPGPEAGPAPTSLSSHQSQARARVLRVVMPKPFKEKGRPPAPGQADRPRALPRLRLPTEGGTKEPTRGWHWVDPFHLSCCSCSCRAAFNRSCGHCRKASSEEGRYVC